jgi:hypothetical protein
MDQRKLEFAFRLKTMAADRLPARVASASWPVVARKGMPAMHAGVVSALEQAVDIKVPALAAAGVGKAAFKTVAGDVVRARDVRAMRRRAGSTVLHHLRVLGDPARHTNQLQRYLTGPLTESQRFKFICRAGVMPTARRQWQQGRASTAKCLLCPAEGLEETMHHALLACSAFATERDTMWAELEAEVGVAMPAKQRVFAVAFMDLSGAYDSEDQELLFCSTSLG